MNRFDENQRWYQLIGLLVYLLVIFLICTVNLKDTGILCFNYDNTDSR